MNNKSRISVFVFLFSLLILPNLVSCTDKGTQNTTELSSNKDSDIQELHQKLFLNNLYKYYLFDVKSFKIMNERSTNPSLKSFSSEEIALSQKFISQIETYAQKYNIALDSVYSENLNNSLYKYTRADVKDFDHIFVQDYLQINASFNDTISKNIEQTNYADLKSLLQKAYTENTQRLDEMMRIKDSLQ